jgi:tape measure domain-containing protein
MAHGGVKIEVNLDKSKLQGSMKGLEGEMIKSMAIFEVLKQGVAKVFNMITDSIDQAMRRIDTMDQFSRVMSTMTGSTDKANAALERTNAIVQGTAFGLDTAAKGVQAFVASGMEVSKATDTMEAWGDAVAFYTKGTNAELETVSAALQKMQTKGNVTMEHMQMMLEAGIPAIQIYASAVGKSTEEVTDQMSKGELKTEDFIVAMNGAFKTGVAGFPSIAGAAKQAGASWQGSQDNMKAAIARGTAAMLEQLDAAFDVKAGMVSFGKGIETVLKTLAKNLDKVGVAVTTVVTAFAAFKIVQTVQKSMAAINTVMTVGNTALLLYSKGLVSAGAASSELTLRQTLAGVATMVLSGQMTVGAAVTLIFKKAVDVLNKAFLANPIVLIITLIAALIAVIVNAVNRTNAAAEAARAEAESIVSAQEELTRSAAESAVEYEKSTAAIRRSAEEALTMADRLEYLKSKTELTAGEQREMTTITATLTSQYSGLTDMVDENSGALMGNAEQWKAIIDAQAQYDKTLVMLERSKELTEQATEAEIQYELALHTIDSNQKDIIANEERMNQLNEESSRIYAELTSGMEMTGDESTALQNRYNDLIDESENLRIENKGLKDANKDIEGSLDGLSDAAKNLAKEQKAQAELAQKQAQIALNAYRDQINGINEHQKISEQMTDEEIANIQALIDAGAQLTDAELEKFNSIKAIRAKEIVAEQDYVEAIKDGLVEVDGAYAESLEARRKNGEELNDVEQATLDRWNEINQQALDAYKAQQQELVDAATDTKEKILLSEQQTAAERLEIQEHNLQVQRDFVDNYNSIMGKIPEEQQKYLAEMTMDDAAFLDSMISTWDDGGKEQWEKYVGNLETGIATAGEILPPAMEQMAGNVVDSAVNTVDAKSGEVQASGSGIGEDIGEGLSSSDAPNAAAQAVADGVVSNLSNADYSAITEAMATAIKSGTNAVQTAAQSMAKSVHTVLQTLTRESRTEMTKTMTLITSSINTGRAQVVAAITTMMTQIITGISSKAGEVSSAMAGVITAAYSAAKSAADWDSLGYSIVSGIATSVRNNAGILAQAVRDVVQQGLDAGKQKAEVNSPSKLFGRELGLPISEGVAEYITKGGADVEKSIQDMIKSTAKIGNKQVNIGMGAKLAMANAGASGGGGSTQSINMGGVTIVRPPETPGQAYRALQRTGRQMIKQFGR